jgi:hypothetical protein
MNYVQMQQGTTLGNRRRFAAKVEPKTKNQELLRQVRYTRFSSEGNRLERLT